MISRVVVNNPSSNVDIKYDYEVPINLVDIIKIGTRVKVPFGNGNRALMGYVVELSDETTYDKRLKQIIDVVDLEPIITKTQLELAEYIKKDTVCPLIRAINLMVPDILLLKPTKYIKVNDYQNLDANLAEAFKGKKIITYTSALAPYTSKIKKAIDNHLLEISYDAVGLNAVKQVTKYVLDMNKYYMYADNFRSDIQPLIRMLEGLEPLTKIELSDRTDLSVYTIQKMIKLELLVPVKQNVSRIKTKEQFAKLDKLIDRANKNDKVDIQLFVMPDSKTLTANVYSKNSDSDNYFCKSYTENALTKLFKGPVGFIEKLVNVADKKAKKIEMLDSHTYNDILSKME